MLRPFMSAFGTLSLIIVATDISVGTKQITDLIWFEKGAERKLLWKCFCIHNHKIQLYHLFRSLASDYSHKLLFKLNQ